MGMAVGLASLGSCESIVLASSKSGCTVQMHIVKNWMVDNGAFDPSHRVPLILGIWGPKGQGVPRSD